MGEIDQKLLDALDRFLVKAKAMDPRERFARMVARGLIDEHGQPTANVPGVESAASPPVDKSR